MFGAVCLLVLSAAIFSGAPEAQAAIKVTFVNKTDRTVSVAILTYVADTRTKGWYNIKPGASRTITFNDLPSHLRDSIGYCAESTQKGKKARYWRGTKGKGPMWLLGDIHPTKSFAYPIGSGASSYSPKDAVEIMFRQITKWKVNGDTASATVTLTAS